MLSKLKYVMSKSWVNSQMETCFWGLARFSRSTWRDMFIGTESWLHGRVMIFQIFHVSGPWHGSSLGTNRHCPSRGTVEVRFLRPLFFLWSYALPTQALTVWVHRLLLFSLGAGASLPPRYRKLHYTAFRGSAGRNNQPSVDFTDVPSYSSHPSPRDGWL